jgi:hypothetical protein
MFLQFEQFDGDMVDIKKVDTLTPPHRHDWEYWPQPPRILTPIGTNKFKYLYYHPEKNLETNFLLESIPMRADLLVNQGLKSEIGYGLLLVDSRSGAKQAWSLALVVFTHSLAFGAMLLFQGLLRWISTFFGIVRDSNLVSMTFTAVEMGLSVFVIILVVEL